MVWNERGACLESESDLFFDPRYEDKAKALCHDCKVRRECLAYAISRHDPGIWGGTNDAERRELRGITVKIEYSEF